VLECQYYLWFINVFVCNMHAPIRIGLRDSRTTYCSLTNYGFVSLVPIKESVFGVKGYCFEENCIEPVWTFGDGSVMVRKWNISTE